MKLGIHTALRGWTDTARAVADALQAECFLWMEQNRPQDALAYPDAVHILRIPNPHVDESGGQWWARVAGLVNTWVSAPVPAGALILQLGNEPDTTGYDLPVAWDIPAWKARHTDYLDYLRTAHPSIGVLSAPFTCANTKQLDANYVAPYQGIAVHCYFAKDNPGWRGGVDGGAAWVLATAYGKPVYITELGCNPQDAGEILAWLAEAHDQPLLQGMCLFLPDAAGTEFAPYNVSIEMAAAVRDGWNAPSPPAPAPPPPEPPMNPYAYDGGYAYGTFTHMLTGALSRKNPSVMSRENYRAVHAAAKQENISVATLLGWIVAENVDPDLIAVNNLAGIYYVGQSRATPGPLGPANEGSKPYCAFPTLTDFWVTLAINIMTIDPDAWQRGDLRAIAREYTGGVWGEAKVDIVDWLRDARAYPHGALEDAPAPPPTPAPSSGPTLGDIYRVAAAHLGNDRTDEGNPEYGMCEQFVEEVVEEVTGQRVRYPSAAAHGADIAAQGRFILGRWKRGMILCWDGRFDVNGHTCVGDDFPYVITTYRDSDPATIDVISRIDAVANGWYTANGYLGAYVPDGVSDSNAPVMEVDVLIEGHLDPAMIERLWYGSATKTARRKMAYNPGSGIGQRWKKELLAGHPLGAVQSGEEQDAASGRVVQFFTSGAITFIVATGETFVN